MKLKALVITLLLAAGVLSSAALAKGPPGGGGPPPGVGAGPPAEKGPPKDKAKAQPKAKPATTKSTKTKAKKPKVAKGCVPGVIQLRGELTGVSANSLTMKVEQTNRQGLKLQGKTVTVEVAERTKVLRYGPSELEELEPRDRLTVLAQCKKVESSSGDSGDGAAIAAGETLDPPSSATFVAKLVVATASSSGGEDGEEDEEEDEQEGSEGGTGTTSP